MADPDEAKAKYTRAAEVAVERNCERATLYVWRCERIAPRGQTEMEGMVVDVNCTADSSEVLKHTASGELSKVLLAIEMVDSTEMLVAKVNAYATQGQHEMLNKPSHIT